MRNDQCHAKHPESLNRCALRIFHRGDHKAFTQDGTLVWQNENEKGTR